MAHRPTAFDYEPVARSQRTPLSEDNWGAGVRQSAVTERPLEDDNAAQADYAVAPAASVKERAKAEPIARTALRRGHALSFAGLLLFTAFVYFRPYELFPALSGLSTMAFWLALVTLIAFIPAQLSVEGTLTVRPREVNLALALLVLAFISIPFAMDPLESLKAFVDFAKVITMFVVMVNVVRTERRLRSMFWLSLVVSFFLSVHALNDYRLGNLKLHG